MSSRDKAVAEANVRFDTSQGPGQIMRALAEIENEIARLQVEYPQVHGEKKRYDRFMEIYEAELSILAAGDTVTEKKLRGKAQLKDDEHELEYQRLLADNYRMEKRFEILDTLRSIGQSILKALDKDEAKFGQGAGGGP